MSLLSGLVTDLQIFDRESVMVTMPRREGHIPQGILGVGAGVILLRIKYNYFLLLCKMMFGSLMFFFRPVKLMPLTSGWISKLGVKSVLVWIS
jgi:hypothetical protein